MMESMFIKAIDFLFNKISFYSSFNSLKNSFNSKKSFIFIIIFSKCLKMLILNLITMNILETRIASHNLITIYKGNEYVKRVKNH